VIYSIQTNTAANTSKANRQRTELRVTKGLVYKVEIDIPYGAQGLSAIAIYDGSFSVWPSTVGQFFRGNDIVISFDDLYLKETAPYHFDIYTWNTDTVYSHIIDVRLGMVSKEIYKARFLPTLSWKEFAQVLEETREKQLAEAKLQKQQVLEKPFEWLGIE